MVEYAMTMSAIREEADPVWYQHVLRSVLGHGPETDVAAYLIDTDVKRLVFSQFLGARGGTSLLSQELMRKAFEQCVAKSEASLGDPDDSPALYLNSLFDPRAAIALHRRPGAGQFPSASEVLVHSLDTDALLSALACLGFGVVSAPSTEWRLQRVDPLHEASLLGHVRACPHLSLRLRQSESLYAFPLGAPLLAAPPEPTPPFPASFSFQAFSTHASGAEDMEAGFHLSCGDTSLCAVYRDRLWPGSWRLRTSPPVERKGYEGVLLRFLCQKIVQEEEHEAQERGKDLLVWVSDDASSEGGAIGEADIKNVLCNLGFVRKGMGVTIYAVSGRPNSLLAGQEPDKLLRTGCFGHWR